MARKQAQRGPKAPIPDCPRCKHAKGVKHWQWRVWFCCECGETFSDRAFEDYDPYISSADRRTRLLEMLRGRTGGEG